MEQNLPVMVKKAWSLMRVVFFMLKKGITKAKLFTDLNLMIKRGKLAGKSLHNLLFHHHHHWSTATFHRNPPHLSGDYQFSCSNTPQYPLSLFKKTTQNHHRHRGHDGDTPLRPPPPPPLDENNEVFINAAVMKALDMLTIAATGGGGSPGFGKSPVKRLRITDSPFPVSNGEEDGQVDEAADKFIMSFYNNLKRQG